MQVESLWRHPIKGFSPQALPNVRLEAGKFFPFDRYLAIEDGPSGFDPDNPLHISKMKFVVLARSARVANFETYFHDERQELEIYERDEDCICTFDLSSEDGLNELAEWFQGRLEDEFKGPLRVLRAPDGHRFVDHKTAGFVSLINTNSVAEMSKAMGVELTTRRFRGNIVFSGDPWIEDQWEEGQKLQLGDAVLEVICPTRRCKATHANPKSATYDAETVPMLMKNFGRNTCGVYARIVENGLVTCGDVMRVVG